MNAGCLQRLVADPWNIFTQPKGFVYPTLKNSYLYAMYKIKIQYNDFYLPRIVDFQYTTQPIYMCIQLTTE